MTSGGTVKVAVNVTMTVYTPVTVDDADGYPVPVPCSSDSDCTAYTGATCQSGECATSAPANTLLYVTNQPATDTTVQVPCDNLQHTVEVYAADQSAAPFTLSDKRVSDTFTMPTTCTAPTLTWTVPADPSFQFPPTIYAAGLPAPYNTYTVQVQNLKYPWAGYPWSVVQGANVPTYSGASATFAAPAAGGTLDFQGTFSLARSLLLSGEAPTSWSETVSGTATAVSTGSIPLP